MTIELATAYVNLVSSSRGLGDDVIKQAGGVGDEAGKRYSSSFGGQIGKLGGVLAAGLASIGVGKFVSDSVKSLARIETYNTQTEAVIASTGAAAGVSAQHIFDLTGELENLTATEAETVQEGANFLLTFKEIKNGVGEGNDVFDQTVRAMTDMARATGTDMKGASLQLGKALNDPIKGVMALSRVGVGFTDQQKEQIKVLQESGDIMGAQKIILGELESQFGGSAEAYAQTAKGSYELLMHAIGTFGEAVMSGAMEPLAKLARAGADGFNWMAGVVDGSIELPAALQKISDGFKPVQGAMDLLFSGDFTGREAWGGLVEEDSPIVGGLLTIRGAALDARGGLDALVTGDFDPDKWAPWTVESSAVVDWAFNIREGALNAYGGLNTLVTGDYDPAKWAPGMTEDAPIVGFFLSLRESAIELGSAIGGNLTSMWDTLSPILSEVGAIIMPALVEVWETLKPAVMSLLPIFAELLPLLNPPMMIFKALIPILPQLAEVVSELAVMIADVLAEAMTMIAPIITELVGVFMEMMPIVADLAADLLPIFLDVIQSLIPVVSQVLKAIMPFVKELISKLAPILPVIGKAIAEVATVLAQGFASALTAVMPLVTTVLDLIVDLLPPFMSLIDALLPPLVSLFERLAPAIESLLGFLVPLIEQIVSFLVPVVEGMLPVFETVFATIGEVLNGFMTAIGGIIDFITGIFSGDWQLAWDGVLGIFGGLWDGITALVTGGLEMLGGFFSSIWDNIVAWVGDLFTKLWNWGWSILDNIVKGIESGVTALSDWFIALPGAIGVWLAGLWSSALTWGSDLIGDIVEGIGVGVTNLKNWFIGLPSQIWGWIEGLFIAAVTWGEEIIDKIVEGIGNVAWKIAMALTGIELQGPSVNDITGGFDIVGNADGGAVPRGLSMVGEEGPELVWWGAGAPQVISNPDSARLLSSAMPSGGGGRGGGPLIGQLVTQPGQDPYAIAANVDRLQTFRGGYGFGN